MNKTLLKTTLFALISFILVSITSSVCATDNSTITQIAPIKVFNPIYKDTTYVQSEIFYNSAPISNLGLEETNPKYTSSKTEIANTISSAMGNRENVFNVYYASKSLLSNSDFQNLIKNWVELSFTETNVATQGDYLRYSWHSYECGASYTNSNGIYNYNITFNFTYFTTKAQETQLTTAINNLIKSFKFTSSTSDKEKIDTIYSYITSNIKYDYDGLNNPNYYLHFTAYAALINKKAVCEGYSVLFYRLAKECGINARVITGYGTNSALPHCWNIVEINNHFYYLDATWDSELAPNYSYYLKGSKDFLDHKSDSEFNTEKFFNTYPIPMYRFNKNDSVVIPTLLAPAKVNLSLSDGHDDVKVTWAKVPNATGYYVYYKKCSSSSYTLMGKTTKTYCTKSNLADGTKYRFKIVPYYMANSKIYKSNNYKTAAIYTLRNLSAPEKVSLSLYGHDDVKVSWSKVPNASGYYVYYKKCSSSSYTLIGKTTKTYYKKSNLADGTKYRFKIVPYYVVNSKIYKDDSYKSAAIYTLRNLSAPKKVNLSLYGHDDVKVSWSKVPNASGYYFYYKKCSSSSYTLMGKTTKTYCKKANLADGTKYRFKIVPYYVVNSKIYKDDSYKSAAIYTLNKTK